MVSFNVSQLLLMGPGEIREFDFSEPFPDPDNELHLRGPISGHARLTRTSEGILAHSDFHASATLECARCLDEAVAQVDGVVREEFLPSTDIHTGLPTHLNERLPEDDQLLIDERHVIDLNEVLRQNILTSLPMHPLCDEACPGLCPECGERLGPSHVAHAEDAESVEAIDPSNPFAQLAVLLHNDEESH